MILLVAAPTICPLKVEIPPTVKPLLTSRSVKLDVPSVLIPPPINLFAVIIPVKFPPTPLTSVIVILGDPLKPAAVPDVFWLPEVLTPGKLIFADPSKETPPIVLAVVRPSALPAVSALPVKLPINPPVDVVTPETIAFVIDAIPDISKFVPKNLVKKFIDFHKANGGVSRWEKFSYLRKISSDFDLPSVDCLSNEFASLVDSKSDRTRCHSD